MCRPGFDAEANNASKPTAADSRNPVGVGSLDYCMTQGRLGQPWADRHNHFVVEGAATSRRTPN